MPESDEHSAPTTLREWNNGMPRLSKDQLLTIIEDRERPLAANGGIIIKHDHSDKAWELVDEDRLEFDQSLWAFREPTEG